MSEQTNNALVEPFSSIFGAWSVKVEPKLGCVQLRLKPHRHFHSMRLSCADEAKQQRLGDLPPLPGQVPEPERRYSEDDDTKKITDFGVEVEPDQEDPYANHLVKERKKIARESMMVIAEETKDQDKEESGNDREKQDDGAKDVKDPEAKEEEDERVHVGTETADDVKTDNEVKDVDEETTAGEADVSQVTDGKATRK